MVRTLHGQRTLDPCLYFGERVSFLTKVSEKTRDELIEGDVILEQLVVSRPDVYAASLAKLDPAAARQLAICRAHRVRVYVVTPRQIARAWQTLGDFQVVADNAKDDLRH